MLKRPLEMEESKANKKQKMDVTGLLIQFISHTFEDTQNTKITPQNIIRLLDLFPNASQDDDGYYIFNFGDRVVVKLHEYSLGTYQVTVIKSDLTLEEIKTLAVANKKLITYTITTRKNREGIMHYVVIYNNNYTQPYVIRQLVNKEAYKELFNLHIFVPNTDLYKSYLQSAFKEPAKIEYLLSERLYHSLIDYFNHNYKNPYPTSLLETIINELISEYTSDFELVYRYIQLFQDYDLCIRSPMPHFIVQLVYTFQIYENVIKGDLFTKPDFNQRIDRLFIDKPGLAQFIKDYMQLPTYEQYLENKKLRLLEICKVLPTDLAKLVDQYIS